MDTLIDIFRYLSADNYGYSNRYLLDTCLQIIMDTLTDICRCQFVDIHDIGRCRKYLDKPIFEGADRCGARFKDIHGLHTHTVDRRTASGGSAFDAAEIGGWVLYKYIGGLVLYK